MDSKVSTRLYTRLIKHGLLPRPIIPNARKCHDKHSPAWQSSAAILDEWSARKIRPTSLRQLTVFGRVLTDTRLFDSANYVRLELPTRIAHRLSTLQSLPYSVLLNPHLSAVFNAYHRAFTLLRQIKPIKSLDDNQLYCGVIKQCLSEHMSVIPSLTIGIVELVRDQTLTAAQGDELMIDMLRSRISRRVIAEQHLSLTTRYHHTLSSPKKEEGSEDDGYVGAIFLKLNARDLLLTCARRIATLATKALEADGLQSDQIERCIPSVNVVGDVDTTFPYIPSHMEYILSEILRNSIQASIKHTIGRVKTCTQEKEREDICARPIEVLVSASPALDTSMRGKDIQHQQLDTRLGGKEKSRTNEEGNDIIIRISDRGGGIDPAVLPFCWSFARGPRLEERLRNLARVPKLAGRAGEVQLDNQEDITATEKTTESTLGAFTTRSPKLRLGIGLPLSRIYAEYWAGSLELHNIEGYGVDTFLQISKLGNRNEVLSTRARVDGL